MEAELRKKNVICSKCGVVLGVNVDKTYFQVGNIQLWFDTAFSCVCGKNSRFKPTDRFSIKGFDGETRKVLINLGKKTDKNRGD
jgi:transcription elongation factor Elf1